jgi:hypothetical protein
MRDDKTKPTHFKPEVGLCPDCENPISRCQCEAVAPPQAAPTPFFACNCASGCHELLQMPQCGPCCVAPQAGAPTPTQPEQTLCSHGVLPEWCDSCAHTFRGCLISDMAAWIDALGEKTETIYGGSKLHARHDPRCDAYLQQSCNCGLAPSVAESRPSAPNVEEVSAKVHEQWMVSKREKGVTSRKSESGEELMVPYRELSEAAKDLDRGSVRAVLSALNSFESRPSAEEVQRLAKEWWSQHQDDFVKEIRGAGLGTHSLYDTPKAAAEFHQWMQERITRNANS